MTWDTVIGIEVHAQLKTHSKLFSNAPTRFGALANAQTHYIDAGLPGTLPVLNQKAVEMAIQFGLAIDADVNDLSYFERKNYFYPDLPKGYQISQYQRPIVSNGSLEIHLADHSSKIVTIERAHLEEDAGKSLHDAHFLYTGIDLNRAGTPLLEIVTTPCLTSATEAVCYLKTLHQLLRFMGICDGNMQEGSFRCDINISLKPTGSPKLGVRTELKNLNSFRFIEKAILFEQQRHQDFLETNQTLVQQTRLYCPETNTTHPMRNKETENDYRYFPDPDLLPIRIDADQFEQIKANMPELPAAIKQRLTHEDGLSVDEVDFLLSSLVAFHYYETVKKHTKAKAKLILNWLKGTYMAALNEHNLTFEAPPISAQQLGCLLNHLSDNTLSTALAKQVFAKKWSNAASIDEIIQAEGYQAINDNSQLETLVINVIANFPQQAAEFKAGKEKLLGFFVGQIMKQTKGQGHPELINTLLRKHLA